MNKRQRGQGGFVQAGEIPLMKQLAKKYAPPTHAQLELVEAAAAIRRATRRRRTRLHCPPVVLCTLPHSDPGDTNPRWLRRTGNSSLIIQPGWDGEEDRSFGYPYGIIPRLLLFWITTEVQHTKNRETLPTLKSEPYS